MKIAITADTNVNKYTTYGFDQRLGWLCYGLKQRGHQVTLFALPNSKVDVRQARVFRSSVTPECILPMTIAQAFKQSSQFDIIHNNALLGLIFSYLSKKPVVHTVSYADYTAKRLNVYYHYPQVGYIAQAEFLLKHYPKIKWLGVAYNGVPIEHLKPSRAQRQHLLWLGRIHPEKQPHLTIAVSKSLKLPLVLAGPIQDEKYFQQKIKPYLSKTIRYFGIANFKQKIKLYQQALVFLSPMKLQETCSNAILEAQACGTPVVAFDRGSTKEIIKQGQTGWVVKNITQMIAATKKYQQLKAETCRQWIVKNFSVQTMARAYEKLYLKMIKKWPKQKSF